MTRVSLIAMAVVLLAGVAAADTDVNVYPQDTSWTGGVFYIPSWPYWGYWWENPMTWGNFLWMTTPCNERGFARYDLTPIPDGANVTTAVVHYFVAWDTLPVTTEIRLLNIEPMPDSEAQAEEVYDSIGSGTLVAALDSIPGGWNHVTLNDDASRAIEERLRRTDWLGLGWLYTGTDSADAYAYGWRQDSLRTYLTVTYDGVGVEERPTPDAPRLTLDIRPNPVRSGFAVLRLSPPVTRDSLLGISIFDASGRVVQHSSLVIGNSSAPASDVASFRLDLRSMPAGVYLVRLTDGETNLTQKLVMQR